MPDARHFRGAIQEVLAGQTRRRLLRIWSLHLFYVSPPWFLSRFCSRPPMLHDIRIILWRRAMDDLFMFLIMSGLFLLMAGIVEICARLARRR